MTVALGGQRHRGEFAQSYEGVAGGLASEVMVRTGISEEVDLGVKGFGSGVEGTVKWQFLDETVDMALLGGGGVTMYETYITSAWLMDVSITPKFEVILGPKLQWHSAFDPETQALAGGPYAGGVLGISIFPGDNVFVGAEVNALTHLAPPVATAVQGMWYLRIHFGMTGNPQGIESPTNETAKPSR